MTSHIRHTLAAAMLGAAILAALAASQGQAQAPLPTLVDPNLAVREPHHAPVAPDRNRIHRQLGHARAREGLGQGRRVTGGAPRRVGARPRRQLRVERGLLGSHCTRSSLSSGFVYLYWTESSTGADTAVLADVPLLGNRVDRFRWNGSALTFDRNLIHLRAFQADAGQPLRGNHNGGVIRFGPDGKLYIVIGDNGRRGQLQNLVNGPFGPGIDDDQFGGPEPDDAHLTGTILRLNDDGSTPTDNPFFAAGATMPGQVRANIQKVFAYSLRNSFGMAFDPVSGTLWEQENGDDSFSELNIAEPGFNSG